MNSVQTLKKLRNSVFNFEECVHNGLGPLRPNPNMKIFVETMVKGKTVCSRFNEGLYKNLERFCGCDRPYCFVCLLMTLASRL